MRELAVFTRLIRRSDGARICLLATLILVLGALSSERQVSGAEPVDAEALINQGNELRKQGQSERALSLFQRAYALERTPRSAGQLGLCELAVGYWLEAEAHLGEALEFPSHPWVAKFQQPLRDALARARAKIAEVTITGGPAGAEVRVNGRVVGSFPLSKPIRMAEGRADIEVSAPGYRRATRGLVVAGGEKPALSIVLEGEGQPPAGATLSAAPSLSQPVPFSPPPSASASISVPPSAAPGPSAGSSGRSRTLAYVAAGAGVFALGVGVLETLSWQSSQGSFNDHLGPPPGSPPATPTTSYQHDCGETDPGRGGTGCQALYDSAVRARALAVVGFGLGAALGVTSAILFLAPVERASRPMLGMSCAVDPVGRAAGCAWAF